MFLNEIAYLITSATTTRILGTNLFIGQEASRAPDNATFCHEYPGQAPQMVMSSSVPAYENPKVQIVERSTSYQAGRKKAETWHKLLIGQANSVLKPSSSATGCKYLSISSLQSPFYGGQDGNGRHQFICNYLCSKALST